MSEQHPEAGQTTILAVGLALVCFAVAGVAVDGTRAFLFRRTLQNTADAAALAGAAEIDRGIYYSSAGRRIVLDSDAARTMATTYLQRRGIEARASVQATSSVIEIQVRAELPTTFLGLVGVEGVPVGASASAEPLGSP